MGNLGPSLTKSQELYLSLLRRGFTVKMAGSRLAVEPGGKLSLDEREAVKREAKALACLAAGACPGACPGALNAACRGGPSPDVEVMDQSGLIAPNWCKDGLDAGACWWRKRGEQTWRHIDGRPSARPPCNYSMVGAGPQFAEEATGLAGAGEVVESAADETLED